MSFGGEAFGDVPFGAEDDAGGSGSITLPRAVATWLATSPSVTLGTVSATLDAAIATWVAFSPAIVVHATLPRAEATWLSYAPSGALVWHAILPRATASWIARAVTATGGASTTGKAPRDPRRIKIPGYHRGRPVGLTPGLQKELEKIERAQSNSDTVFVQDDYKLLVTDRNILVDTSIKDVTIQLLQAETRFELPVSIVKISDDFNNVIVQAWPGDGVNDAEAVTWTDPFVAYSMHPDGRNHWWLEGFNERITKIKPGTFVKIVVNGNGRITGGLTQLEEQDLLLSDVTTNNATADRHGFMPRLSNDPSLFFNGKGEQRKPVNWSMAFLLS